MHIFIIVVSGILGLAYAPVLTICLFGIVAAITAALYSMIFLVYVVRNTGRIVKEGLPVRRGRRIIHFEGKQYYMP